MAKRAMAPKFLAYLVILCFERRRPKQSTVGHWMSKDFSPTSSCSAGYTTAADDAMQMGVNKTLVFALPTPQRTCPMLRQQSQNMRFVGSNIQVYYDNLHNRLSADFKSSVLLFKDACRFTRAIVPAFTAVLYKFELRA